EPVAIDLDDVWRDQLDPLQRRGAGTEIVDRDADAELPEARHKPRQRRLADRLRLGDLADQQRHVDAELGKPATHEAEPLADLLEIAIGLRREIEEQP